MSKILSNEEMRKAALSSVRSAGVSNPSTFALVQFARDIEQAVMAKLLEQNEPIYQRRCRDGTWIDHNEQSYKYNLEYGHTVRKLYEHPAPSAPEGMVLVPIEPTEAMLQSIIGFTCKDTDTRKFHYKAMLAAARSE